MTVLELLGSIKQQAVTQVYKEQDDTLFFKRFDWIKDAAIRQRILIERAVIRRAVTDILAAEGGAYVISVYDGEEYPLRRSRSIADIMENVCECDDEWLRVRYADAEDGTPGQKAGGIRLVYGNDGWDVIADYSVALESLLAGANKFADELGDAL